MIAWDLYFDCCYYYYAQTAAAAAVALENELLYSLRRRSLVSRYAHRQSVQRIACVSVRGGRSQTWPGEMGGKGLSENDRPGVRGGARHRKLVDGQIYNTHTHILYYYMHIGEHAALGTTTYRDWFPPRRSRHSRSAVVSVVARRTTIIIIIICAYAQVK